MKLSDLITAPAATAFVLDDGTEAHVRLLTCDQLFRYHALIQARAAATLTGQMPSEAREFVLWLVRWGICDSSGRPIIANDDDFAALLASPQSPEGFKRLDALACKVMEHNGLGKFAEKKT